MLEFTNDSAKHVSTRFSPFMFMYGFQPTSLVRVGLANEKPHQVKEFLQDHINVLQVACQGAQHIQ